MLCQVLVARETLSSTCPVHISAGTGLPNLVTQYQYVAVPAGTSNDNTKIDTVFPTEDEDEIKRWKLVSCSAQLQLSNSWVRFRCKLLESQGFPEEFEVVKTSENVLDCKVYRMANHDRPMPFHAPLGSNSCVYSTPLRILSGSASLAPCSRHGFESCLRRSFPKLSKTKSQLNVTVHEKCLSS